MTKVLVVEDDREINNLICEFLSEEGYGIVTVYDGMKALRCLDSTPDIDIVLLDIMLPFKSGDAVLEEIRKTRDVPVIIISAKDMVRTKIDVLRLGADDYITKPFDLDELLVRMEAVLRRYQRNTAAKPAQTGDAADETILIVRNLSLDTESMAVTVAGHTLDLTGKEYAILELFLRNPKKLFSKANLYESIWHEPYIAEDNTLKVHMSNIRNKIKKYDEDEYIETVWGMGYKLKN